MALQGNPFLGKLKVPAPDLSKIPDNAFSVQNSVEAISSNAHASETQNKVRTNPEQPIYQIEPDSAETALETQNKVRTNPEQARALPSETQNKVRTNPEQASESQNKPRAQPRTKLRTKSEQTQNNFGTTCVISQLSGMQRQLMIFVYDLCRRAGEKRTGPVSLELIAENAKTSVGAAQVTTRRLMKKGVLGRASFRNGRGGWTDYELPEAAYNEMFSLETQGKLRTNPEQTQNKVRAQPRTQPRTSAPSSSSSDLDLRTTGTSEREGALPPEWASVEVAPLAAVGFTQSHVRQLHRAGLLTAEELQDSINTFAFDLEMNGKAKKLTGPPLNFFMGCLRKGPYAPPENYEHPETRQRRLYLEAKEKAAKARRELEEKLEALEFDEWLSKLSLEERARLVPATEFAKAGGMAHNVEMRRHFREHVWPERQTKIGTNA